MVSGIPDWVKPCYVATGNFELLIPLPPLTKCWDYRQEPPYPAPLSISVPKYISLNTSDITASRNFCSARR